MRANMIEIDDTVVQVAEAIYGSRRSRTETMPADLFGEPAWDILLALFLCAARDRDADAEALRTSLGLSRDSFVRWLAILREKQLVQEAEPERAGEARLSKTGFDAVQQCLRRSLVRPIRNG